jgi:uncharacterized repeat protein (TIGR02543 family)
MTRVNSDLGNPGYGAVGIFVEAWETANNGSSSTIHVQGGYYNNSPYDVYASTAYISLSGRGNVSFTTASPGDHALDSYDIEIAHAGNGDAVNASFACYGHSTYPSGDTTPTVTIATSANPRYTIAYDGAGGSGVPGSQTKIYGITSYVSSSTPTRNGYSFSYWSGSDGGTYYPGNAINTNGNVTLTAIWSINYYSISYNANSGSNAPGNTSKAYGSTYTLPSTVPTRNLYNFKYWSGSDGGTYYPSGSFTGNYAITFTAIWELAYISPTIDNMSAYHCTSDGTASDDGTYIKAVVTWHVDTSVYSDNRGAGINVTCNGATTKTAISGTSATTNIIIGGSLNADTTYTVTALVYDTKMGTSYGVSRSVTAPGKSYAVDIDPSNNHVCIGGAAESAYQFCVKVNGNIVFWVNSGGHG